MQYRDLRKSQHVVNFTPVSHVVIFTRVFVSYLILLALTPPERRYSVHQRCKNYKIKMSEGTASQSSGESNPMIPIVPPRPREKIPGYIFGDVIGTGAYAKVRRCYSEKFKSNASTESRICWFTFHN